MQYDSAALIVLTRRYCIAVLRRPWLASSSAQFSTSLETDALNLLHSVARARIMSFSIKSCSIHAD